MPPVAEYKTPEELKKEIFAKVGPALKGHGGSWEPMNNQVLCAIYKRPEKTKGGIIISEGARKEDEYQGKTLLILAVGPIAFQDDDGKWFRGRKPQVGDWITIRASDGWALNLNNVPCRMIDDTVTRMVGDNPEEIW